MEKLPHTRHGYLDASAKTAQYLAGLTTQQDLWRETGEVLIRFFGADLCAFGEGGSDGEVVGHHWTFSEQYVGRRDLQEETRDAVAEVLENGFLTLVTVLTPGPLSIVCLPITVENRVAAVMLLGHVMSKPLPASMLNVYLAVAGLVGTTAARLAGQRELGDHRLHLERLVEERTAELTRVNGQLRREVAERRQAQEALLESETKFRSLFENANDAILLFRETVCVDCNAKTLQMFGCLRDQIVGQPTYGFWPPLQPDGRDSREKAAERMEAVLSGDPQFVEWRQRRHDGTPFDTEVSLNVVEFNGERLVQAIVRDITERRQAEQRQEKEISLKNLLLDLYDKASASTNRELHDFVLDQVVRLTDSTIGFLHLVSHDEKLIHSATRNEQAPSGHTTHDVTHYPIDQVGNWVDCVRLGRPIVCNDLRLSPNQKGLPEGHVPVRRFMSVPIIEEGKSRIVFGVGDKTEEYDEYDVVRVQVVANALQKILGERRAEDLLKESEATLRAITSSARDAIVMLDQQGRISFWNEAAAGMLGWEESEVLGHDLHRLIAPDSHEAYRLGMEQFIATGRTGAIGRTLEFSALRKDNTKFPVELSLSAVQIGEQWHFVGIMRDITERRRAEQGRMQLERQLQQSQKLESLGVLAGGIAHDFNNILTAVLGNAELALAERLLPEPARMNLLAITHASQRAAELCRQMLAYSGRGSFVVGLLDLSALVEDMLELLRTSVSKKTLLNLNLGKDLPSLEGDASQLSQVIMNLVINASEAIMGESGVITISTGAMECTRDALRDIEGHDDLVPGRYLTLQVSDTGVGMDKDTQSRLFDPFFTTKFTGRGLGLSAVLGIVRSHKGAIEVHAEPGQGTTFRVLFPVAPGEAGVLASESGTQTSEREEPDQGTVLLVDDEEIIRTLGASMLSHLGFQVLLAADGREALEIYGERRREIDLVLLDLTMPNMDGEETFRELHHLDPDVRVVMSSGYSQQEITSRLAGEGVVGFLQKPYTLAQLKESLRSERDRHEPSR